ncbi:MAG: glycosyltransferase family 2 protein [Candidatus Pacebacteria bacterium]|nr:glycosyltransferase family 2 protein [Candidatus Paceibacterota bacterium]
MRRFFEMLPGFLAWGTLILAGFLSWKEPVWVAFFIILFDTYWFFRTVYLTIILRYSFSKMRQNMKINWMEKIEQLGRSDWKNIHHLIILPMYKEPHEVIWDSFKSLEKCNYDKSKFILVLATEERAGSEPLEAAERIKKEFSGHFEQIFITKHPSGLPGEIPGKGSNETWSIQEIKKEFIDKANIPYENILVSIFDVDTQVYPEYFACLTYNFLTCKNPQRSSFQPIPVFANNFDQVSPFARLVSFQSTFWQMMRQVQPERLTTFSSHSMPFKALVEIGYWQKDIVSEDSRIFWQCYLHYNGNWEVIPLLYPISMDANAAPTLLKNLVNIYRQQRRWAHGAENTSYILTGFFKNKFIPIKKKLYWAFELLEGNHSWATSSLIIATLGWLPTLIGSNDFNVTVLSYKLPQITSTIMTIATFGLINSAILSLILLSFHFQKIKIKNYILYLLEWILTPVTLVIFGAIPALEAQTRLMIGGKYKLGFWVTPKDRYGVKS